MKSFKQWIALGLLLSVIAGCCPTCDNPQSYSPVSNAFRFPFGRIAANNGTSTFKSFCSGTLVDVNDQYGLFMTCNHCTRNGGPYTVTFCNGETYIAEFLKTTSQHDLTALRIPKPNILPVRCGAYDGQGTYKSYGFGGNGELSCVTGQVVQHYGAIGSYGHQYVGINGKPISGDSGSGVVNDKEEFVGVLWGSTATQGLITMGTPVSDFMRSLVADGLWEPSPTFTPGGSPVYSTQSYTADLADSGYSADGMSRVVVDEQGKRVNVQLCGAQACQLCFGAGCPGCRRPPGGGGGGRGPDEPGRVPIRSPFDVSPEKIETPVGVAYAQQGVFALLGVVAIAGVFAAIIRYANEG